VRRVPVHTFHTQRCPGSRVTPESNDANAGIDEPVSAGAVLSGRGQRAGGGSLDPSTQPNPVEPSGLGTSTGALEEAGPTVLVAVEDTERSVDAVHTALR